MQRLQEMLEQAARRNPDRPAIVDGEITLTYSRLLGEIERLSGKLAGLGLSPGRHLGILLPNGLNFALGYFAGLRCGAVLVPFNEHYQLQELAYLIEECGISLLLTLRRFEPLCRQVLSATPQSCRLYFAEEWGMGSDAAEPPDPPGLPEKPGAVMCQFSSGSTGKPKRISRTHANLLFELDSLIHTLNITPEDRFLGVAPFSHVNGLVRSMITSLSAGATLYPLAKFERRTVARMIEDHRISVFIGVPFMFSMLAKANFRSRPDFSSLRLCVSASAPMPTALNREFHQQFGLYVRQLYGSTETGTISVNLASDVEESLASVGTPIRGVEVDVFDDHRRPAPAGEMGELAVRSAGAIQAYDAPQEANQTSFQDGFFFTGDLGRRDPEGCLYLLGRKKFFINKGGYKINPSELEELLHLHPKVEEAAVVGVPTSFGDEKVKAVIVLKEACSEEEIAVYCRGKIADFKIPSVIHFVEALPKTSTGKIRKNLLL